MVDTVTAPARVGKPAASSRAREDLPPQQQALAPLSDQPTDLAVYDFGEDAGSGLEDVGMDEQLTPFLTILQGLSPQLNRSKSEYVPEARMGMIYNTATKACYDGDVGIPIVSVWREYQYTEWVPRDDYELPDGSKIAGGGGGFRGVHSPDEKEVQQAIRETVARFGRTARFRPIPFRNAETEEGTILTEQYNLGVIYGSAEGEELNEINARRAMIAFTSTKIGPYKSFITNVLDIRYPNPRGGAPITPPLRAHMWRANTVPQSNKKGDFYNWRLRLENSGKTQNSLIPMSAPLYIMAKEFYTQWKSGQVKVDYNQDAENVSTAVAEGDQIPF